MICSHGLDTFDTYPIIYITLMRASACITLPINLYGLFCVIYKTSSDLLEHRRILLLYQIAHSYLDLHTSIIVCPLVYFPLPFGTTFGLLRLQNTIGFEIAFVWSLLSISLMACSAMLLFHYRVHIVAPPGHFFKIQSRVTVIIFRIFVYVFFTIFYIGAYLGFPRGDVTKQNQEIIANYPCVKKLIDAPMVNSVDANLFRILLILQTVQSFSSTFMFIVSFYGAMSTVIMIIFNSNYLQYTKENMKKIPFVGRMIH